MTCSVPLCPLDAVGGALCRPHAYRLTAFGTTFPATPLGQVLPVGVERPDHPSLFDEVDA